MVMGAAVLLFPPYKHRAQPRSKNNKHKTNNSSQTQLHHRISCSEAQRSPRWVCSHQISAVGLLAEP